jgi:hypothetical protein
MKRGFTLKGEGFYTLIKSVPAQYPAYFSLACGIAGQVFLYVMKNIPAGLLFFGLAVAAFTAACGMDREKEKQYRGIFSRDFKMNRSLETALLSLATLAAAFMRLYSLNEIPSGFFVDEAMFGMSSLDILNGKLLPVFEG